MCYAEYVTFYQGEDANALSWSAIQEFLSQRINSMFDSCHRLFWFGLFGYWVADASRRYPVVMNVSPRNRDYLSPDALR